jgi:hypothetical protein
MTEYKQITYDETIKCGVSFVNALLNPEVAICVLFCLFIVFGPGSK